MVERTSFFECIACGKSERLRFFPDACSACGSSMSQADEWSCEIDIDALCVAAVEVELFGEPEFRSAAE